MGGQTLETDDENRGFHVKQSIFAITEPKRPTT
mgnify:CR=1 FL=1